MSETDQLVPHDDAASRKRLKLMGATARHGGHRPVLGCPHDNVEFIIANDFARIGNRAHADPFGRVAAFDI